MIFFGFFLSFLALIFQGLIPIRIGIYPFIPFIALLILYLPKTKALFFAFFSGAAFDLFSSGPIGLHALNHVFLTFFCFPVKRHFLAEKPLHLTLLTLLLSFLSTFGHLLLFFLFDISIPFEGRWLLTNFIGMPVIDALYAFVWFASPIALFQTLKKLWTLFWKIKKSRSLTSH